MAEDVMKRMDVVAVLGVDADLQVTSLIFAITVNKLCEGDTPPSHLYN
jgi:hypothetical protein